MECHHRRVCRETDPMLTLLTTAVDESMSAAHVMSRTRRRYSRVEYRYVDGGYVDESATGQGREVLTELELESPFPRASARAGCRSESRLLYLHTLLWSLQV